MTENTIRVGLADDDALVLQALSGLLGQAEGIEIRWAVPNGREAVEACADPDREVDVLLTDINMPVLDGLGVLDELAVQCPDLKVMMLTTVGDSDSLLDAMARGARGYYVKDDDPMLIASGIRRVMTGQKAFSPSATDAVLRAATTSRSGASLGAAPAAPAPARSAAANPGNLTLRELQVLELLAQSMTNKQIAKRLFVSEATVKTHVSVLIAKLGVTDRVGAAVWAHRNGIV